LSAFQTFVRSEPLAAGMTIWLKVYVGLRRNDKKIHMGEFLTKIVGDLEGAKCGGHVPAAGGQFMKKGGFSGKHTDNYKSTTEMIRNESNEFYPRSVLSFTACHNMTGKFHPTEKPIDLMRYLIRTYSNENEIVVFPSFVEFKKG